jgi:hypothetical protein
MANFALELPGWAVFAFRGLDLGSTRAVLPWRAELLADALQVHVFRSGVLPVRAIVAYRVAHGACAGTLNIELDPGNGRRWSWDGSTPLRVGSHGVVPPAI